MSSDSFLSFQFITPQLINQRFKNFSTYPSSKILGGLRSTGQSR